MDAKELLEKYSEGTEWDEATHLALACEYIDDLEEEPHRRGFEAFLRDRHERETLLDVWQAEVAAGDTLRGFDDWLRARREEGEQS
jgi:hypothetical protein